MAWVLDDNDARCRRDLPADFFSSLLDAKPGAIVDVICDETRPLWLGRGFVLGGGPYGRSSSICSSAVHAGLAEDIIAGRVLRIAVGGARDELLERTSHGVRGASWARRAWPTFTFLDRNRQPIADAPGTGPELPEVAPGTERPSTHSRVLGYVELLGVTKWMTRAELAHRFGRPADTFDHPDGYESLTYRFSDGDVVVLMTANHGVAGLSVTLADGDDDRVGLSSKDHDGDLAILGMPIERVRDALGEPTKASPIELVYDFGSASLTIGCGGKNGLCEALEVDWTAKEKPDTSDAYEESNDDEPHD